MCIPHKYLKLIVNYTSIATIVLGLFSAISGAIIETDTQTGGFFDQTGHYIKDSLIISLYTCGGILVLLGIAGIIGAKYKHFWLLTTFNLGQIIVLLAFVIMSTFGFLIANQFANQSLSTCLDAGWSTPVNQLTTLAQLNLCKEGCPCYISEILNWPTSYFEIYGVDDIQENGQQSFYTCPQYEKSYRDNAQLLNQAEMKFHCAGWCYPNGVYLFTDVNRGPPRTIGGCYVQVALWMEYYGNVLASVSLTIAVLLFISLALACCLCNHPETRNQHREDPDFRSNLYTRLSVYYQGEG